MDKEKTFDELARDVIRKQDNEAMLTGNDSETVTKQGYARTVRGAATEEEKADVRSMYRKGIGVCEIARRTGFAQSTVSRWVSTCQLDRTTSVKAKHSKSDKDTKKEPAPTAIGTSSEVSLSNDTNSLAHLDDSTKKAICQEVENIHDRLVQAYDEDLESNLGIRLYGEAMGLLEAMIHKLEGDDNDDKKNMTAQKRLIISTRCGERAAHMMIARTAR